MNYLSFEDLRIIVVSSCVTESNVSNKNKEQNKEDLYIFFLSYIYYISKKSILLHYTSESLEFYRSIFSTNHTIILIPPYLSLFHVLLKLIPKYQIKIKKPWIYHIYPFYLTRIKELTHKIIILSFLSNLLHSINNTIIADSFQNQSTNHNYPKISKISSHTHTHIYTLSYFKPTLPREIPPPKPPPPPPLPSHAIEQTLQTKQVRKSNFPHGEEPSLSLPLSPN